jgi:hypothetical protein
MRCAGSDPTPSGSGRAARLTHGVVGSAGDATQRGSSWRSRATAPDRAARRRHHRHHRHHQGAQAQESTQCSTARKFAQVFAMPRIRDLTSGRAAESPHRRPVRRRSTREWPEPLCLALGDPELQSARARFDVTDDESGRPRLTVPVEKHHAP